MRAARRPIKESLDRLRQEWAQAWGKQPSVRIGRRMLERSLAYKQRESVGLGLTVEQHARLEQLIKSYRRNPNCFDENRQDIKPGTRLVKEHGGKRHTITVLAGGYEYNGKAYGSLSQIASEIAGTRWNGWTFFGMKRKTGVAA